MQRQLHAFSASEPSMTDGQIDKWITQKGFQDI